MIPSQDTLANSATYTFAFGFRGATTEFQLGLEKGSAKEIGHNLAREQPKFGHKHERNEVWAQFCG